MDNIVSLWITCVLFLPYVISTGVDVRLAGGRTEYEGRVEVYNPSTDTWGVICDTGWDDTDAQVVCRQQGLPGGKARLGSFYGPSTNTFIMDDTVCSGMEGNIIECGHNVVPSCDNMNEAGVMCEPDIRIVGGMSGSEGRVELYNIHTGNWGTVCGADWGMNESKVICHQLGMTGGWPLDRALFDPGTGDVTLSNVMCPTGNETDILQCQHDGLGMPLCKHREDVAVRCNPDVRLRAGSTAYEGRVEVYDIASGSWGTVCKAGWDDTDASVVCKYLGLTGGEALLDDVRPGNPALPIHLANVQCTGAEETLLDCNHGGWHPHDVCDHEQDAGVRCDTPGEEEGVSLTCFVYRDGSVVNFAGQSIPNALSNGKNYVATLGFKDDPNMNHCKFSMMAFFKKSEHKMTWASLGVGVHGKNPTKYYKNYAFERRGATKQLEERGYLAPQTEPKTYIEDYPHIMYSEDGNIGIQIDKLPPFKGWKLNTTCPYSMIYRFKKSHPAIMFKLSYGYLYKPGDIEGICA